MQLRFEPGLHPELELDVAAALAAVVALLVVDEYDRSGLAKKVTNRWQKQLKSWR